MGLSLERLFSVRTSLVAYCQPETISEKDNRKGNAMLLRSWTRCPMSG